MVETSYGFMIIKPDKIADEVIHLFHNLCTEDISFRPLIDGLNWTVVPPDKVQWVVRLFEEEIQRVVMGFEDDKSFWSRWF